MKHHHPRHPRVRRGSALFLVLGVVAAAAMMGAVVLTAGDSTATATDRHAERVSLRAAAWSGVQSAMAELAKQRPDLLAGKPPTFTPEIVLSDEASAEKLVVRLLPWDDADDAERREPPLAMPESARLDLNRATPEMLAALGLAETAVAEIVARRGSRPFASVEELATLSVTAPATDATASRGEPSLASFDPSQSLTTLSFDPNIQAGIASAEAAGALRFNIAQGWSDELGELIAKQLGAEASNAVKRLIEQNKNLSTDADFAAAIINSGIPKTLWPVAFDLFTTSDDMYVPGRVDLNLAPEVVLAAIPGIGKEHAAAILAARQQLSADELRSRVWPLSRDIMKPEEMAQAVGWLSTRSTQWRIRVQASIERGSEDGTSTIRRTATFEAVLDAASERPRLAYLREVTLLPIARAMERRVGALAKAIAEAAPPPPPTPDFDADFAPPPEPDPTFGNDSAPETPRVDDGAKPSAPTTPGAGTMVDRRIGRWNAGTGRTQ